MEEQAPYSSPFQKLIADLDVEIANLTAQKAQAEAVAQQASGAIQMCQEIQRRLRTEAESLTVQEFARMIGGEGAQASISPVT